ncbi:MAG: GAF domain-containing protein [Deltaproteobacteria bacterium]|nr:MAG: GAF domain-containing protein [Deltaproteobacteria bacterium]
MPLAFIEASRSCTPDLEKSDNPISPIIWTWDTSRSSNGRAGRRGRRIMEYHKILSNLIDRCYEECETIEILKGSVIDLVEVSGAYLAKIWLVGPPDLCESCPLAQECPERSACLHLVASAEKYPYTEWGYQRVPFGRRLIGEIYSEEKPKLSNNIQDDERFEERNWAQREHLVSFAGYPIGYREERSGVLAVLSQQRMSIEEFEICNSLAKLLGMMLRQRKIESKEG